MFPRDPWDRLARPLLSIIALATSERLLTSESFKEPAGKIKKCGNGNGFLLLVVSTPLVTFNDNVLWHSLSSVSSPNIFNSVAGEGVL